MLHLQTAWSYRQQVGEALVDVYALALASPSLISQLQERVATLEGVLGAAAYNDDKGGRGGGITTQQVLSSFPEFK